ncbi:YifB family Mg chelatase-like AAA ATPase [Microbispora triticiradicis]|uniref:YifB family Mg chelatase-like AAA ATPase n=1 Tax=Microbispora triticiradicis TaxID=2200763 RepID=UPI001AD70A5F|nr:ATP-binding protein [Microbispora triticiradicis]MBO4269165.1 ATP-binding protein [Microbispora triticiradicis]
MGHASTRSVALIGLSAHVVDVEADAVPGDAELHLVGLPEMSVWPARARIRAAILNSGTAWPDMRITVSVTPVIPPIYDAAADLALVVALLAVAGAIPPERITGRVFLGELALDGGIRPVRGVLPMVAAAVRAGISSVVVPADCAREAAQVPGAVVMPVTQLADLVDQLRHGAFRDHDNQEPDPAPSSSFAVDLADAPGNQAARRALEVCAAGGHHLFLSGDGPATMLAERLPGILPPLTDEAARKVAEIYSLAGRSHRAQGITPPLSAPHHSETPTAIFGSVAANRPGALSLAHRGVLHLADAPEFARTVLDGLCRPMDSGQVHLAGRGRSVHYPARFTLVLAARPCPCPEGRDCACPPEARRRYRARLALLLSRVAVRAPIEQSNRGTRAGEPSAAVAARVLAARVRAAHRLADTPWRTNAEVPAPDLRTRFPVAPEAAELLRSAVNTGLVTADGLSRLLRVAWTLADLRGVDRPQFDDAAAALELWKGADGDGAR